MKKLQRLKKRHVASRRLKTYGLTAIVTISFSDDLMGTIITNGYTALQQTELQVELAIPTEKLKTVMVRLIRLSPVILTGTG